MNNKQHLLIIGFVWPEPNSSAAGGRMLQLISIFQQQSWEITFASPAQESEFMFDLSTIDVQKVSIELNKSSFDDFIKELQPEIVLFDRFMMEEQFGWRVAENCPQALRLLDTEDLHCLRQARQLAFKENRRFEIKDLFSDIAKREIASMLRCDLTLMISEYEMQLLQEVFKVDPSLLYYLPILVKSITEEDTAQWLPFTAREHFIFIGNFLHAPNWNAVQYLKESIWPLIRKELPNTQLHIYGAYPSQKALEMHKPQEGFYVKGRADNAHAVVAKAKVSLAPLRFGAGIKGKLIEAMQCGTPSVTTDIGTESMKGYFHWNGLVANTPEEIAKAAVKLYQDQHLWEQAQQNGIEIINNRYAAGLFVNAFVKKIKELSAKLENHRLGNFMGAMLQHHTLTSTRYMSKWIEEKNKSQI